MLEAFISVPASGRGDTKPLLWGHLSSVAMQWSDIELKRRLQMLLELLLALQVNAKLTDLSVLHLLRSKPTWAAFHFTRDSHRKGFWELPLCCFNPPLYSNKAQLILLAFKAHALTLRREGWTRLEPLCFKDRNLRILCSLLSSCLRRFELRSAENKFVRCGKKDGGVEHMLGISQH